MINSILPKDEFGSDTHFINESLLINVSIKLLFRYQILIITDKSAFFNSDLTTVDRQQIDHLKKRWNSISMLMEKVKRSLDTRAAAGSEKVSDSVRSSWTSCCEEASPSVTAAPSKCRMMFSEGLTQCVAERRKTESSVLERLFKNHSVIKVNLHIFRLINRSQDVPSLADRFSCWTLFYKLSLWNRRRYVRACCTPYGTLAVKRAGKGLRPWDHVGGGPVVTSQRNLPDLKGMETAAEVKWVTLA